MVNPKVGIALGVVGVLVVLLPIVALFLTGGYDSPIQRFYDNPLAPGLPIGLVVTAVGAAVTVAGLLIFVKGMRSAPIYPSQPPSPVRRPLRQAPRARNELDMIEKELESMISEERPSIEVRTVTPPKPRIEQKPAGTEQELQTGPVAAKVVVVTRGVDEVCKTCGAVNVLGAKVCSQCGAELYKPDPKAIPCPVCGAPLDESMKIGENIVCTVCFSELRLASPTS
ncbi:MAG: zinc ribbon domain-containing protein [Candidatus Caldarchaeum sp.]